MSREINIVSKPPKPEQKKRVAAYARVSSGKDAMLHSLSAQVSHYSEYIQSNSEWLYAGVYADEAKTGTKDTRENFQRLISDCRAGKIDMVITKSISRFARNTVTLLKTVRECKSMGVDIYFEEQNIHTLSGDGELMMTILASYAQEESRSISENQKWRIKRKFENGQPWNGTILGYRLINGKYVVVPEEAELVRRIFDEYLLGYGYNAIAEHLNTDGVLSRHGKPWGHTSISVILSDYSYTGNLVLQKTFREDYINKKVVVNNGELPKYYVENAHDAIIDIETFQAVQDEKARRKAHFLKQPAPKKKYPFTSLLTCGICGKKYRRKVTKTGAVWICETYNTLGKSACASKAVPEKTLEEICQGLEFENITVCNDNTLIIHLKDGSEKQVRWKDRSRSESWTDEMKNEARNKANERKNQNA